MNLLARRGLHSATLAIFLGALGAEGRQDDDSSDGRFAREVRTALEAGKEAARLRLREATDAVAADAREEKERDGRIAAALKESTSRVPLRVPLHDNVILDNVSITGYAAGVVTLTWPQGEVRYPLASLPDETRGALIGISLSKGTARDHFEMGKLLVRARDYDRAARCFSAAVLREPGLAPAVPDIERVKRAARLFEGSFKVGGSTLSLRWGFSATAEAADFQSLKGTAAVQPGAGLALDAPTLALLAVKEIPFRNRVRLSALPKENDQSAHLLGIRFAKPDGGVVLIYGALATASKFFMVLRSEDDKTEELLGPTPGAAGNRMTMDYTRGRVSFKVGEKTVWSGTEGGFTDVIAVLGCTALSRAGGSTRGAGLFKEVSLQGEVNPVWMEKKTAALRDVFASELSKEYRAKRGDAGPGGLNLSVDAALAKLPPEVQDAYRAALATVNAARKSHLEVDHGVALSSMEGVTKAHEGFAPAWYCLGLLEETAGNWRSAADYYDRALELLPAFPEAFCGRGRLHAYSGQWPEAQRNADRALALRPDLAEAHLLRARLLWERRDSAAVLEATRIARRLAPSDAELQSDAQQLANVASGPRWAQAKVHESAHYAVRSDLPAAKCKAYAEHLEALRSHYEEVLGRPLPPGKPAEVLIFESEEGYFVYNDYTVGSRQEHTLGAYSPWHGQMALFEGVDVQETSRVLSHEGFHQSLHALAPDVPIWFNEGMAEYVGAARVEKGAVVERGGIQTGRLDNLIMAVKYGWQPLPFPEIMLQSQAGFYAEQAPLKYAQAWSMVRYFMDGDGGRWKPVLKEYIGRILKGDSGPAAFEATFAKQDVKEMEAGWLKHYGLVPKAKPVKEIPLSDPGPAGIAAPAPPEVPVDPERSIPLKAELRRWVVDEDGRQIVAVDAAGNLLVILPAERKVLRKAALGAGVLGLCLTPGSSRIAWVALSNKEGRKLIKVDLEKGEVVESVSTDYDAEGLVVVRKMALCLLPNGPLCAVDLAEKKDLGMVGGDAYSAMAYDVRKDRLWGLARGALVEFDGSKLGPALKELGRKNLGDRERVDVTNALGGLAKRHPIAGHDPDQLGSRMLLDERSGRIYVSGVTVKAEKPEAVLGVFRPSPHPFDKQPAVRAYLGRTLGGKDQILAVSADGKWAASPTHLYNAANYSVLKELPLPTSLLAFSKDSKELYCYDWVNRVVAIVEVAGK
jgi:tetratricopeptide (TPR) repeat protein